MNPEMIPDNPYFLLTPGPLSTSKGVRAAMFRDWCTWDDDYNTIVQEIRHKLIGLASPSEHFTCVLMQGSGTFSVESAIQTMTPRDGKILFLVNGAYGQRMVTISEFLGIDHVVHDSGERERPDLAKLESELQNDPTITHVCVVHCETTTGMLNPIEKVGEIVKSHGKTFFVDAMSSFGGIPLDMEEIGIDWMVSSANKCIQGVPGFGFILARKNLMEGAKNNARSHSLDAYDQWKTMEDKNGKWRFTSPTHTVRAFAQAITELEEEGGVAARYQRYSENHRILVEGMEGLGFKTLLPHDYQSPIITSFFSPESDKYSFNNFYQALKKKGFVIYPGKVTGADTFRIGNIGHVYPDDMKALIEAVKTSMIW